MRRLNLPSAKRRRNVKHSHVSSCIRCSPCNVRHKTIAISTNGNVIAWHIHCLRKKKREIESVSETRDYLNLNIAYMPFVVQHKAHLMRRSTPIGVPHTISDTLRQPTHNGEVVLHLPSQFFPHSSAHPHQQPMVAYIFRMQRRTMATPQKS